MKKLLLSLGLMGLLSGCSYDAASGCWVFPQSANCPQGPSDFDSYQKDGETKEQKTQDVIECGGEMDSEGFIFYYIRKNATKDIKDDSNESIIKRINAEYWAVKKFGDCMENKGYRFDDSWAVKHP